MHNADHANQCAAYLEQKLLQIPGVQILFPREANAVFVKLPEAVIAALRAKNWLFYNFIGSEGIRFMCSWATTPARIDELVQDLEQTMCNS
ncbi:MAG: hypothetical protein EDM05_015125 [Leptolyngbya sp. IPPAS B-1204]